MTIHPSTFPKLRDGRRFLVTEQHEVVASGCIIIARCNNASEANMIAAALERWARVGETFDAEEKPCK